MERSKENYSRSSDVERGIKAAIKNGAGTLASRTIIILGLPLLTLTTAVGGYAVKVTLDGIAKDIGAVATSLADVKETLHAQAADVAAARQDISKLQTDTAVLNVRTDGLQSKLDDLRPTRRQ